MENNKELYGVILLRTDRNHMVVIETDNYAEAHKSWKDLTQQWVKCLKEKEPFVIEDPVVTAFDPAFVYEIVLRPKSLKTVTDGRINNPYNRDMLANGFTNSFGKNSNVQNTLLDEGYQY